MMARKPVPPELVTLAKSIADWAAASPETTIYVFGSRVRGTHEPDSDVDICIEFPATVLDRLTDWWEEVQASDFADLKAALPGPLKILEEDEPLWPVVLSAPLVYSDRNVRCVWTPPKPIPHR